MNFRYPRHSIQEIIQASKSIAVGHSLSIEKKASHGSKFDAPVELLDGPFCDMRFLGKAGRNDDPASYDSSFLLEQQRVRGIGYNPVARRNFRAKLRIPKGWHQNICDPNVATSDPEWNRHEALPDFKPSDFGDFVRKAADMWNIDLDWEAELL